LAVLLQSLGITQCKGLAMARHACSGFSLTGRDFHLPAEQMINVRAALLTNLFFKRTPPCAAPHV